jgi:hypothetical protein
MSRPTQPGDAEEYERARHAVLTAMDELGISSRATTLGALRPGWNYGNLSLD